MSPSISLSQLCWNTPDERALFSDLDLVFTTERMGLVGRNGVGKTTLLRLMAGALKPRSGRIQITGRLSYLRQNPTGTSHETLAALFGVTDALARLRRADAGVATVDDLENADWTLPSRMEIALAKCDLHIEPDTRLAVLSGGQRSRAALAAMIFTEPDFLLLDEPTNNLDRSGRQAVIELIRSWKTGAIIVSHDRELLEEMDAIVELTSLGATRYGGPFSHYRQQKEIEQDAAERALAHAQKAQADVAQKAQTALERKARSDSRGRKSRQSGSQPKVVMNAARERAQASGGAGARLREARLEAANDALNAARQTVETLQPVSMDLPPTGLSPQKRVLRLERVYGGYDSAAPIIQDLSFTMTGPGCWQIKGPNGCGKTTLLKLISGELPPVSGAIDLPVRHAVLDQDLSLLLSGQTLLETYLSLSPSADQEAARSALARFGFRTDDALALPEHMSGGERLRAALACTLGATPPPQLLILDEPTNHLDLDGIIALQTALTTYDGAMIVVSHDPYFIDALACDNTVELGAPIQ